MGRKDAALFVFLRRMFGNRAGDTERWTPKRLPESLTGGDRLVPRRRGVMSEEFKVELAKDLGFYDTVQREGWGGIRARDAGNMVRRAIEIAEKALRERHDTDL